MFYDFFEIENSHSILLVYFFYIFQKNASSISIHKLVFFNIDEQKFEIHEKITNAFSNAYVINRRFDFFENLDKNNFFFVHH